MNTLSCPTTKTILGEWEDVYCVRKVTEDWGDDVVLSRCITQDEIDSDVMYYQTFGGGPEGGFFVRGALVFKVSRGWFQPWKAEELKNLILEYEPEDFKAGKTARCRTIQVYSLRETRTIIAEHCLDSHATDIVKCLRDGLSPKADESYKTLCLGIILHHFAILDEHLDLLPPGSSYKEVLHEIAKDHADKEDGESESESE
jgi:hypothetical protein